jgi:hypothetical protein
MNPSTVDIQKGLSYIFLKDTRLDRLVGDAG